jgi:hypothetical protein
MMLGLYRKLSDKLCESKREKSANGTDMAHHIWLDSIKVSREFNGRRGLGRTGIVIRWLVTSRAFNVVEWN